MDPREWELRVFFEATLKRSHSDQLLITHTFTRADVMTGPADIVKKYQREILQA